MNKNDIKKQTIYCQVCKEVVEQRKGRGRLRETHPLCRRLQQLLSWLEDIITLIPKTPAIRTYIRSNLFRISNLVNEKESKPQEWTAQEMIDRC